MMPLRSGLKTEEQLIKDLRSNGYTVEIDDLNGIGFNAKYHVHKNGKTIRMMPNGNFAELSNVGRKEPFYSLHHNTAPTDLADARKALFS